LEREKELVMPEFVEILDADGYLIGVLSWEFDHYETHILTVAEEPICITLSY
jgi:hypothetical protein